ncbi:hypothetical protein DCS_07721 [Drechmeria coniospora]|uniref:Uncharacterized protein n=1 Tax=Drechmeria coniospora TaxID=98403 RepID=A0A151GF79_DRECN|nr:hypothetical protein DCS_07721 [Drechmeria coniospora]KYK55757.1 hypothetical protein DCS_07721 [Drechmeria coniospora]
MDAAAKTVESLSQHVLPEKPHHLSYNPHWRFRPRHQDAAHEAIKSSRFEEWHNTRLQYMTLVSQADRGTLLTRSYYDMREEPPKPVPREVAALARSGVEKKKLSLSDYKNKKTALPSSSSPPDHSAARKSETERTASTPAAATPDRANMATAANAEQKSSRGLGAPSLEAKARDLRDAHGAHAPADGKQRPPREVAVDQRLPPKPPALPPKSSSPVAKKRLADNEEEVRPQKRSKPDERRPMDERLQHHDDTQRRKDRLQPNARDASQQKDDKSPASNSLTSGKATLKGTVNSSRNLSPAARQRDESVNGAHANPGAGSRDTPTKPDAVKSSVPPLLSPLHLSFDSQYRNRAGEETRKERRKKYDFVDGSSAVSKTKKPDGASGSKNARSSMILPPLLSPTLPPVVEAELRKRKKGSSDSTDDRAKNHMGAYEAERRPTADKGDDESSKLGHRRRLIVTLSIPKPLRHSLRKILAVPTSRKDGQKRQRETSDETLPPARKRTVAAAESVPESVAAKRPRTSDSSRLTAAPSTPSRKSTNMSRVGSENSLAQTPSDAINATPKTSASADRKSNGPESSGWKQHPRDIATLQEKADRLQRKAKDLKHNADLVMRSHRESTTSAKGKAADSSKAKLGYVLSLEGILAFSMAFQATNLKCRLQSKKPDHTGWSSMLPLLEFLQNEMRRDELMSTQPPFMLLLLIHAVCLDELLKCYANMDNASKHTNIDDLLVRERKRARLWPMIRELNANTENPELRVELSPWYTIDEVTKVAFNILKKWCAEENVEWTQEPVIKQSWPIQPGSI